MSSKAVLVRRFVNDCILTVLHHVGTDLDRADLLCYTPILRTFSRIFEEDFNASALILLSDDIVST